MSDPNLERSRWHSAEKATCPSCGSILDLGDYPNPEFALHGFCRTCQDFKVVRWIESASDEHLAQL
jgi:hypothetical protein